MGDYIYKKVQCCLCLPATSPHDGASPARVKPIIDPAANWGKYPIITGTPSGGDSFIWGDGWPLVNQPFIGMVGPWLTIYSFIWGVWLAPSLVWLDLACTSSLTQNRQGLNSNHFPSQIYIKYAFSCLKTDVALVGHKNQRGLNFNLLHLLLFHLYKLFSDLPAINWCSKHCLVR